jgi:hypothetical protein
MLGLDTRKLLNKTSFIIIVILFMNQFINIYKKLYCVHFVLFLVSLMQLYSTLCS